MSRKTRHLALPVKDDAATAQAPLATGFFCMHFLDNLPKSC